MQRCVTYIPTVVWACFGATHATTVHRLCSARCVDQPGVLHFFLLKDSLDV